MENEFELWRVNVLIGLHDVYVLLGPESDRLEELQERQELRGAHLPLRRARRLHGSGGEGIRKYVMRWFHIFILVSFCLELQ